MSDARSEMTRRTLLRLGLAGAGMAAIPGFATACSSKKSATSTIASTTSAPSSFDALLGAARRDGKLNLIAISDDPDSAYHVLLEEFRRASHLELNLTVPPAGSAMEVSSARQLKGKPDQPDVIDVGTSFAADAAAEGLFVASTPDGWVDVPSVAKDPSGLWTCAYYGVIGIVSDPATLPGRVSPATLDDLKGLPRSVTFGFPGDPRTGATAGGSASAEAFAAVWTVALANGGSFDDIGPGIEFFADLAKAGVFQPTKLAIPETLASGAVQVTLLNNFEFARTTGLMRKAGKGASVDFRLIPATSTFPNYYAQGAVKGSPHPNAAKLWLAYLLSEQGAKAYLAGGAIPTRFPTLYQQGVIADADLKAIEPLGLTAKTLSNLQVPLPEQVAKAQQVVNAQWGPKVLGT